MREERCPISTKAIRLSGEKKVSGRIGRLPSVEASLCNECGICENKCPTNPRKAIHIMPL
ncbi:MAG: 4Fe-4S binding protein [Endomicrobiales bacterium]